MQIAGRVERWLDIKSANRAYNFSIDYNVDDECHTLHVTLLWDIDSNWAESNYCDDWYSDFDDWQDIQALPHCLEGLQCWCQVVVPYFDKGNYTDGSDCQFYQKFYINISCKQPFDTNIIHEENIQ